MKVAMKVAMKILHRSISVQDLRKLRKEAIYFTQQVGYFSYLTPSIPNPPYQGAGDFKGKCVSPISHKILGAVPIIVYLPVNVPKER